MKRLLQYFIVKTDIGPLAWIYRLCYAMALKWIVYVFKKQPEIITIYLISGLAADSCTPGLSDIDLIIIVNNAHGSKEIVRQCFTKISRMVPFLKNNEQGIYTVEEIKQAYTQSNFYLKYKLFTECRKQGRILYGMDFLRDFKELGAGQRNEFIIGQMAFTWMLLLNNFLINNKVSDGLIRNYFCYKLTSYICGAFVSARHNQDIFNRRKALESAVLELDTIRQAHIREMICLMDRRFSGHSSYIFEDTYEFCINTIQDTIRQMPAIPECVEDQEACNLKNYDFASFNFILSDVNKCAVDTFVDEVIKEYAQYITSVLVSPLDLLHIEEQNIGVFITVKKHLPVNILRELVTALKPSRPCPQHLCLYMANSDIAISMDSFDPSQIHSAIFSLRLMSPTLLYLSSPEAVRYGEPLCFQASKKIVLNYFWHDLKGSIAQDKAVIERLINDQHILRASNIEFQSFFWQSIQLNIIENSFNTGDIFIPLSSKQVCQRCRQIEGINLPWLEEFHDQYRKDLNGIPSDSEVYFSQALEVLRKIYVPSTDTAYVKG